MSFQIQVELPKFPSSWLVALKRPRPGELTMVRELGAASTWFGVRCCAVRERYGRPLYILERK